MLYAPGPSIDVHSIWTYSHSAFIRFAWYKAWPKKLISTKACRWTNALHRQAWMSIAFQLDGSFVMNFISWMHFTSNNEIVWCENNRLVCRMKRAFHESFSTFVLNVSTAWFGSNKSKIKVIGQSKNERNKLGSWTSYVGAIDWPAKWC